MTDPQWAGNPAREGEGQADPEVPVSATAVAREAALLSSAVMSGAPVPGPVRLWSPRSAAVAGVLLGFPGVFGVASRNAWRLGRRRAAWLLLLGGAALFGLLVFGLPEELPRGSAVLLNLAAVAGLFAVMRQQVRSAERAGTVIEAAPGASGLATFLGGWVTTAGPTLLLLFTLTFLGSQVTAILAGTVTFGTSGVGCQVDAPTTSIPVGAPIHYVASLSREVRAGESIQFSVRMASGSEIHSEDTALTNVADCVHGTIPASVLSSGTYAFEFSTGAERLAFGELVVAGP